MSFEFEVTPPLVGKRLDAAVAEVERALSRAQISRLIAGGNVTVSGTSSKPARKLRLGDVVAGRIPAPRPSGLAPEPIPLVFVYQDRHVAVVDKPPGLVVHPAAGHASGTLVNALLYHCPDLAGVGDVLRPGIVHRLDKDTSGLIVAAKNDAAHRGLAAQFKAHTTEREYLAIVRGSPGADRGTVDAAIARHPTDRKRYTADRRLVRLPRTARQAVTHWRVEQRLGGLALLRVRLETGRTHQIRVHLASVGLPVAGDPVYGGGRRALAELGLRRQALHAAVIGFTHPVSATPLRFESPLPADLAGVVERLRG